LLICVFRNVSSNSRRSNSASSSSSGPPEEEARRAKVVTQIAREEVRALATGATSLARTRMREERLRRGEREVIESQRRRGGRRTERAREEARDHPHRTGYFGRVMPIVFDTMGE